jgi:hypothetical protein
MNKEENGGKSALAPSSLFQWAWPETFYQSFRGWRLSRCFSQNSRKGLLLMICPPDAPSVLMLSN